MTWLIPVLVIALGLVLFLLYWNGIASVTTKRAIMFVGDAKRATFHGCTGRIRRIVRVKESGSVRFALEAQLSHGDMSVELTDPRGELLLRLTPDSPEASADLTAGERYRLVLCLTGAGGSFRLHRSDEADE